MEVEAADPAVSHLHRGEMGITGEGERRQFVSGRREAVAVNHERGHNGTLELETDVKLKTG
jgi:hypothetical protein